MAISDELMLKIENVSKVYKLGEIGGTTLRDELQRLKAKILKKEDPTKKIGAKNYNKGEKFKALDNISFEVKKGERIGIIGHNGAGKSTLLKLISRVTGPTEGSIYLNGRVASMLEVGTGFHPELTGRENIYMNGAILGMTKKEIDAKMEDIIEFSEVRQFIDTPVKRYSSGMYVKLAFSVAAHLDSELMIMDEVLAVGDVTFQNKCLQKMKDVSEEEGRTILYVSHNMNTVLQLCNRVIVLEKGNIIYDGNVENGIKKYLLKEKESLSTYYNFDKFRRPSFLTKTSLIESIELLDIKEPLFEKGKSINFELRYKCFKTTKNTIVRMIIKTTGLKAIATLLSDPVDFVETTFIHSVFGNIDTRFLTPDDYVVFLALIQIDKSGNTILIDTITNAFYFTVVEGKNDIINFSQWDNNYSGNISYKGINILQINDK